MFHNRFDLLKEFFPELWQDNKKQTSATRHKKTKTQPIIITSTTAQTLLSTTAQVETLFNHIEALKQQQSNFELWLLLHENLRQVRSARAEKHYHNQMERHQDLFELLDDIIIDLPIDSSMLE
jgi:hypothetical protein